MAAYTEECRKMEMISGALDKPYISYPDFVSESLALPSQSVCSAVDLFAGCGGLSLGFEAAGIGTTGYEMDRNCCESYRENLCGDCIQARLPLVDSLPKADILVGGPPCQPFSVRGRQKGTADKRNGFPAFIAAVEQVQPRLLLFENVRGMLYKNRAYFDSVANSLGRLGYKMSFRLLNAKHYAVPQSRERVICVGAKDGREFAFPEPEQYLVPAGDAVADLAVLPFDESLLLTPNMDRYIAEYERRSQCVSPRDLHLDRPARTLTCRNLAGATSDMHRLKLADGRRRRLAIREAARLQSFPDWFIFCGNAESQYRQIGNAVPPMLSLRLAKAVLRHLDLTDSG